MKKLAIILLVLFLAAPVQAEYKFAEKWSWTDTAMQVFVTGALVADWQSTRYTAEHPEKYSEMNPILGEHPSTQAVDIYFAGAILGTSIVAPLLPPQIKNDKGDPVKVFGMNVNPRLIFQSVIITMESVCIMINW